MDRWQMWAGPSKHFLVFPVRHGTMVNYVGFVPTDEEMKESWSAPGDPEVLRREFEGWDPRIGDVLQQVDKTFAGRSTTASRLPTWTKGRLTLLGDAAHPMLPHLGQGANQSIEDGMALATILGQVDTSERSRRRLLAYERLRRERVAQVQLGARRTGCASIPPPPTSACATPSWPRTPNSASSSTPTTWCRKRSPPRPHSSLDQAGLPWPSRPTRLNSARISAVVCSGVA
jgi:2-polyprenyl-6-methoxyphenol hydroxylase-like FAD-dependent oxidoreductase